MEREHAPDDEGPLPPINWWPMIFAIFIVFFPLALLKRGNASESDWALAAFAVVSFVGLLATAVACWQRRVPFLWVPAALAAIGFVLAPYNYTAVLFFLFAAAIFPWAVDGDVHRSVTFAVLLVLVEIFLGYLEPVPAFKTMWLLDIPIFTIGNVAGGVWIVRMTLNIRRLGRVAVRERITRDLHDVLGNALSRIAIRSGLAACLLTHPADAEGARQNVEDAEIAARRALADVRRTIQRYRSEAPEIDRADAQDTRARFDWWPMLVTLSIAFLPVGFWRAGDSIVEWLLVAIGILVLLALVTLAVVSWQRRGRPFRTTLGAQGDIGRTVRLVTALIVVEFFIGAWNAFLQPDSAAGLRDWWWITVPIFTAVSATGYLWAVRMSLRQLALAKAAERERIARDLHDVLGHTLSVITLKSELAGRLLNSHPDTTRARAEIADIEHISRQALADVKRTILGDRVETIDTEFERATSTLRTAGIAVECRREAVHLDTVLEGILGLALREAVTNIVRHAEARTCSIRLQQLPGVYVLEVQDDGRGGTEGEGLGLRGMRERIESLGGSVLREISTGTRLTVRLPGAPIPT